MAIKTKLEQIETATELVQLVSWQGVSTKQEDICKMQDIIGHSTIKQLDELANDNKTQSTFYHLLSVIWSWEDLIKFWNVHTDPGYKELRELRDRKNKDDAVTKSEKAEAAHWRDMFNHQVVKAQNAEKKVAELETEILKLKAKLYDMMTNNGAA